MPPLLLRIEGGFRVATFVMPLMLPLALPMPQPAVGALVAANVVDFATWVPHLWFADAPATSRAAVILGPAITPLGVFLAIAVLTHSGHLALVSAVFIALHVTHNLFGFRLI